MYRNESVIHQGLVKTFVVMVENGRRLHMQHFKVVSTALVPIHLHLHSTASVSPHIWSSSDVVASKKALRHFLQMEKVRRSWKVVGWLKTQADWDKKKKKNSDRMPVGGDILHRMKAAHTFLCLLSKQRWSVELCRANSEPSWVPYPCIFSISSGWWSHCSEFKVETSTQAVQMREPQCVKCMWEPYMRPRERAPVSSVIVCALYIEGSHIAASPVILALPKKSPVIKSNSAAVP